MLDHVLTHWKTSLGGVLIAVLTVTGVLSQQGITLGHAGAGTVVALIGGIATALLGLLAQDPRPAQTTERPGPQKAAALLMCALLVPALMPATGCTISQAQLIADGNALSAALTSTAKVMAATDPATAQKLLLAANALSQVTANWNGTSSIDKLNAIASGAEVVLAAIPQTAIVTPFLPIAIAALDVVLANTQPAAASARVTLSSAEAQNLAGYRLAAEHAIRHRLLRSPAGDFKAAWNGQARISNLPEMVIR